MRKALPQAIMSAMIFLGIGIVLTIPTLIAVCLLWEWFVVPIFGLPALSLGAAFGLLMLLRLIKPEPMIDTEKLNQEFLGRSTEETMNYLYNKLFLCLAQPSVVVAIGWMVKSWSKF